MGKQKTLIEKGNYKEARQELNKAMKVFEKGNIKGSTHLGETYRYFGELEFEEENYDESELNIGKSLEIYKKTSRKKELKTLYSTLIKVYEKTGKNEEQEDIKKKLEDLKINTRENQTEK